MTTTIGVIGVGKIAQRHFRAYDKMDDVELVASDIDASKKAVAEDHGSTWISDPSSVIEMDVDAIDICTPVSTHRSLILGALSEGKDIFCEKPLARNAEEAKEIHKRVRESGANLMVGYLYRHHPAFQFAKSILEDNIIGDPYHAIFRVGGRGSASAWKHKSEQGGGVANEMLVHMVDLITWYFDRIETAENLYSDIVLDERLIDGNTVTATATDIVLLKLRADSGVEIICESDLITPSYMNHVEIHGDNGSVWTSILDYFPSFVYCQEPRGIYDRGHNFDEFGRVDLFEKELTEFVEVVANGDNPRWDSVEDSVKVHRIIDQALQ